MNTIKIVALVKGVGFFVLAALLLAFSTPVGAQNFVRADGTRLVRDGQTYRYVGTNFWYAPILASTGQGGNRERLARELDRLQAVGIDNLRILVGADAGSANVTSVSPVLQEEPGMLNDTLLDGLDYLLAELERRRMLAVLYLTNSWDWSGGYGFYLKQTGHGDSPDASGDGWTPYCNYAAQFYADTAAVGLYLDHVRRIVGRTNRYTGRAYRDDPAIMAWQLCNEPRPFTKEMFGPMLEWSHRAARLIKSIDPNHLVSTGSEGIIGCAWNEDVCRRMHADAAIDYLTVHVWPINWGWSSADRLLDALPNVYLKAGEYIAQNERLARSIGKPMVVEEFGYARDQNLRAPEATTKARDSFYNFVFSKLVESARSGGPIAGCNFWGWGGEGIPAQKKWVPGQDYLCDPPHEPQGWYSVYDTDSTTLSLVRETVGALGKVEE